MASKILKAATPRRAKQIANEISVTQLNQWYMVKGDICVMKDVSYAKAMSNIDFKNIILNSGNKILAENTRDLKWGTGLSPFYTKTTIQHPGDNLSVPSLWSYETDYVVMHKSTLKPWVLMSLCRLLRHPPSIPMCDDDVTKVSDINSNMTFDDDDPQKDVSEPDSEDMNEPVNIWTDHLDESTDNIPHVSESTLVPPTKIAEPDMCTIPSTILPKADPTTEPMVLSPQWKLKDFNTNKKRPAQSPLVANLYLVVDV